MPTGEKLLECVQEILGTKAGESKSFAVYILCKLTDHKLSEIADWTGWTVAQVISNNRIIDERVKSGDPAVKETLKAVLREMQRRGYITNIVCND